MSTIFRVFYALALILIWLGSIVVAYGAVGWAGGGRSSDYLSVAFGASVITGPLLISGVHCLIFRWGMDSHGDRAFIRLIYLCASIPVLMRAFAAGTKGEKFFFNGISYFVWVWIICVVVGYATVKTGRSD